MSRQGWQQTELDFEVSGPRTGPGDGEGEIEDHMRRIAGYLTVILPEPVDVVFTDNRSTMVSFKRRLGRIVVRLHRLFRHADSEVLDALALYLGTKDKDASNRLDSFIEAHRDEIATTARRRPGRIVAAGRCHDLEEVLERVNDAYFDGQVEVRIGWGRAPAKRRRTGRTISRALATYSYDDKVVRVSPVLDSADVPDFVLDWIVYHELLHHVLPVEEGDGKKRYHTRRFKVLERAFAHYDEARAWEKANLERLLL